MTESLHRVVLDTNVLLRGVINPRSASGAIVTTCDKRTNLILLSRALTIEYHDVLLDPRIRARYPILDDARTLNMLRRLRYVCDYVRTPNVRFEFTRDPKDAKLIELAIAARATHLVTTDRDLLSLTGGSGDAARRLRQRAPLLRIVEPVTFVRQDCRHLDLLWNNQDEHA